MILEVLREETGQHLNYTGQSVRTSPSFYSTERALRILRTAAVEICQQKVTLISSL
jgi:hypothetical protein